MLNRTTFYTYVRRAPFGGRLLQKQIDGMEAILKTWEASGSSDLRHLAYELATTFHETDATMEPIREYGRGKGKRYGKPGRNGGQIPYGRGLVQLTWDENYERADRELAMGGRLVKNYDLALQPSIAARILHRGMTEGWFTGKRLRDYFNTASNDAENARRIINGTDKAKLIASYHKAFRDALEAADSKTPQPADVAPELAKADDIAPIKSRSIWAIAASYLFGGGGLGALGAVNNPWAASVFIAVLAGAGGIGIWLLATGRVDLKRFGL